MTKVYPSKVDWWIGALMALAPLISITIGIVTLAKSMNEGLIAMGAGFGVGALIIVFAVPCRYMLEEKQLVIQSGLFRQRIPYGRIRGAKLSMNPLSSPALSLKRVRINLDRGFRLVSPVNREKFIEELMKRVGTSSSHR